MSIIPAWASISAGILNGVNTSINTSKPHPIKIIESLCKRGANLRVCKNSRVNKVAVSIVNADDATAYWLMIGKPGHKYSNTY